MSDPVPASAEVEALLAAFVDAAFKCNEYYLLRGEQAYWKKCNSVARELIARGEQDRLIALASDPRPVVKYYAARLVHDVASDVTRRALTELSEGTGMIAQLSWQWLGLLFADKFDEVFGKVPKK